MKQIGNESTFKLNHKLTFKILYNLGLESIHSKSENRIENKVKKIN